MAGMIGAKIKDGQLTINIAELLDRLETDEKIEIARHLACQADMLEFVIKHLVEGRVEDGSWISAFDLEQHRLELVEKVDPVRAKAIHHLIDQLWKAKADAQAYSDWGWDLLRLLKAKNPHVVAPSIKERVKPAKVVVLSGSSRFIDLMAVVAWEEEKRGNVTMSCHLLPDWYCNAPHHMAEKQGVVATLDKVHLAKIDLCDELLVIDFADYIGESTKAEIQYALDHGKPVRYLSKEEAYKLIWARYASTIASEEIAAMARDGGGYLEIKTNPSCLCPIGQGSPTEPCGLCERPVCCGCAQAHNNLYHPQFSL